MIKASIGSALDLAGADEPSQVLAHAQLTGLVAVDGLRQLQRWSPRSALHEIEKNVDLAQFRPKSRPSSSYPWSSHRPLALASNQLMGRIAPGANTRDKTPLPAPPLAER